MVQVDIHFHITLAVAFALLLSLGSVAWSIHRYYAGIMLTVICRMPIKTPGIITFSLAMIVVTLFLIIQFAVVFGSLYFIVTH